jgi:NitT/TauT family transport system permease protein
MTSPNARVLAPLALGIFLLVLWEVVVSELEVPVYVLPGPLAVFDALLANFSSLMGSLLATLKVTVLAFLCALVGGVALAALFSQSRTLELMLYPYAVILQVTPVVAIAPLILIWVGFDRVELALLILAWIVAFFPILSSATLGFKSVDPDLKDLFKLYGASRWQVFSKLQMPNALPHLLNGMKVSAGLALIGAVVAEFVAGSGAATGLAWRIVEAGNRLQIPKMFAALLLLSLLGVVLFFLLSLLEHFALRKWHESVQQKNP